MIEDVLAGIDGRIGNFAQDTFAALAADLSALVVICGVLGFLLLTINILIGIVPAQPAAYFAWAVRFVLVTAASTSWAFFLPIYNILTGLGDGIAGLLLGGEELAAGLQETTDQLWKNYNLLVDIAGWDLGLNMTALCVGLLSIALTVAAILVIGGTKIGLAVAIGLAPIFLFSLLFKATHDLFVSWSKWVLTFVMTLIISAGIIAILGSIVDNATARAVSSGSSLFDMLEILVLSLSAIFVMSQSMTWASALAGSVAAGGVSLSGALRDAKNAARPVTDGAKSVSEKLSKNDSGGTSGRTPSQNSVVAAGRAARSAYTQRRAAQNKK